MELKLNNLWYYNPLLTGGISMLTIIREYERYLSIYLGIGKNLLISICASKGPPLETID
jgi:hypothetical protein